MHKVKRIGIKGFRRLHDVEIEMRPLMVMIGANGVGKTSFLDGVSLLSASASDKETMNETLSDMGGVANVLTRERSTEIALSVEMEVSGHKPLKYDLHIKLQGLSYEISREQLSQERTGDYDGPFNYIDSHFKRIKYFNRETNRFVSPDWEHDPLESSLSQVPKMFREPEEFRNVLSSVTQYHALDVGQDAPVKRPQQMKPVRLPGKNGEDLVPFLYSLRESDRDRYDIIEDTLKAAFPGFESLNFPPVAAGTLSMTWKEKQFKDPMYPNQLSEGTLRFLWLISLLQSPGLSTITMIDEPEVSLHPELLRQLADQMREASERTQIIVATHSDRLISFLKPEEVVVMDIDDDGFASAKWADSFDLDEWLADYSLDEVWRMGRMGGRS